MLPPVIVPLGFALTTAVGAALTRRACVNRPRLADGPARIGLSPWVVPVAAGLLGCALAARGVPGTGLVAALLLTVALGACVTSDCILGVVPDVCTIVPLAALAGWAALHGNLWPLVWASIAAAPFAVAAIVSNGRGMGWGDVKLIALGAVVVGPALAVLAMTLATVAVVIAARGTWRTGVPIAFVPYLAGGLAVVLVIA